MQRESKFCTVREMGGLSLGLSGAQMRLPGEIDIYGKADLTRMTG